MNANPNTISNLVIDPATNLRNGSVADVHPSSRQAAIPACFGWTRVTGMDHDVAHRIVGAYIRVAFASLAAAVAAPSSGLGGTAPAANANGFRRFRDDAVATSGTAADWQETVDNANRNSDLVTKAIALGAARSSIARYWCIVIGDVIATETNELRGLSIVNDVLVRQTARVGENVTQEMTMEVALAIGMGDLIDDQWDLAHGVFQMAASAPVLAGLSLLDTDHHYLSSNTRPTTAVERQVKVTMTVGGRAMWDAATVDIRDMLWHKACHPIKSELLRGFALNASTKDKMTALGLGSAAVRLPYVEAGMKAALAMMAVVTAIQPALQMAGYIVEMPLLSSVIAAVQALTHSGPVTCTYAGKVYTGTRRNVVVDLLHPVAVAAEPFVAFAAGYYKNIMERADVTRNEDTLLKSYAVTRLLKSNIVSFAAGRDAHENFGRFIRKGIEEGRLPGISLRHVDAVGITAAALPAIEDGQS